MIDTVFTIIDRSAPGLRAFAEAVARDLDHILTMEGVRLGDDAYLQRYQRLCYSRQAEWQDREDYDYRTTGEVDGHSAHVRRSYYTLALWCNKASRVA
jgi:hypothetical protein